MSVQLSDALLVCLAGPVKPYQPTPIPIMKPTVLLPVLFWALLPAPQIHAQSPSFGENVQPRGSLENSRIRCERDKTARIAFMGGSITEMNGYRPMVMEHLQKRFPNTKFEFVDAGISSTCSTTGAFRLPTDVLAKGPIDLFFLEFAVNDDQDAHHTREACIRGMEGIIRQTRKANPNTDIVLTYFVNEGMLATLQKGETPLTMEAHETVAKQYGVSTIHLGREVARQISSGTLTWKEYGGVHPAPFGNAICARMISELLDRQWASPLAEQAQPKAHLLPAALDAFNYESGRFVDPARAVVKSGWTLGIPDWAHLPGGKRERFTKIPLLSATEVGAEVTLEFEGTAIGAFVVAGPDAGMVEAGIDGTPARKIDVYHSYSKGLHYPRTVMFADELTPGKHTLTLRISSLSNSPGHAMRIIQFVVN